MKAFKVIGAIVGMFFVAILGIGLLMPPTYRVERSIDIVAPPAVIFAEVDDLRRWQHWSPWVARDPSMVSTYAGPASGVGARVTWTSEDSGEGTQEITLSEPPSRIESRLDFGQGDPPTAYFDFEGMEGGTRVTWGLRGKMDGVLAGVLAAQMERWVGPDYSDGLVRLKKHVEALPSTAGEAGDDEDAGLPD